MKRRTALMGARRGPWMPLHGGEGELVVSGLTGAVLTIETHGELELQAGAITEDGRYSVRGRGWLRAVADTLCPTLACQLEH